MHVFLINKSFISKARLKLTKNQAKAKQHSEVIWLITMKTRLKIQNRSHRYGVNRPRLRHRHSNYTKSKMCLIVMMAIGIKQHQHLKLSSWKN